MVDFLSSEPIGLTGLAVSAFLSSTLLPGGSEAVLLWLVEQGEIPLLVLLAVATAANGLGGFSTYWLGWWIERGLIKRRFSEPPSLRSLAWIKRWGYPVLLLSWLPIVGDGLCLAAGWLRLAWLPALVAIVVGKGARYGVLIYLSGLV
ncbi:MAG: YqaA family protein [Porticoccaceae bacterium]